MASISEGWILYAKSPVRDAGLSLALTFMTVLSWSNIVYGFALAQCISGKHIFCEFERNRDDNSF